MLFPSYAYGLPPIVSRFVKEAVFNTPYIAAFVTYGSNPGGTLSAMRRILKKKNTDAVFFGRIPSVENYTAMFGPQKAATIETRTEMQRKATEEAAGNIIARRTNNLNGFHPFSALISKLFTMGIKVFYRHYRLSDECDGCEICKIICPVSAIVIRENRPVFSEKCEHCQGCVNICPRRAIHFGRVNSKTPVYHHPEISVADLARLISLS